jgi:hypothetical protein
MRRVTVRAKKFFLCMEKAVSRGNGKVDRIYNVRLGYGPH